MRRALQSHLRVADYHRVLIQYSELTKKFEAAWIHKSLVSDFWQIFLGEFGTVSPFRPLGTLHTCIHGSGRSFAKVTRPRPFRSQQYIGIAWDLNP